MSPDLQTQMSQISVSDFRVGLDQAEATTTRDAEATATRHATELAEEKHQQTHQHLLAEEKDTAHSLAAARAAYEARKADTQDCAIVVGSRVRAHERAKAAVLHSSRNHEIQLADLNNRPCQPPPPTSTHPTMVSPSPRPSSSTAAARTERRTQPDTRATVASGIYHAPQPTPFDDSYLDVRVYAFRHHNEELPRVVRDQIYDLSLAVFTALRPIRQTKAPLRLARDLASSQLSPFRPEMIDDVLTQCDAVRQAYNTPAARPWFLPKLPQPRAAPRWQPHPQTDSSASDSSVGLNRQRRRDDPASGRGKAKRTMTAITTDSESGSDAPQGTYDGYRHNRQVSPRFYHAPDPDDGTEPSFPPRITRNRVERRAPPPRPLTNHTPALVPHAQRGSPPANEDLSPLPTQLLIETIKNATLAAVNQYLMSAGLLPRPTVDPQPTELSLTRTAPPPSTLVQKTAPTLATNNVQYLSHDARYKRDGGSPHSANTASPTAFDRVFTAKMQAE